MVPSVRHVVRQFSLRWTAWSFYQPSFLCRRVDWNAKVGDRRKNRLLGIRGITVTNALASPRDVDLMCNYWHLFDWLRDSLIDRFQWQSWCWQPQSFQRCSWRIAVGKIINIVKASPRLAPLPPAASPFVSCHTVPVGRPLCFDTCRRGLYRHSHP